jgi:hypothetical protein
MDEALLKELRQKLNLIGIRGVEELIQEALLDKEQLRQKLNLISIRGVDELVRRRKIPCVRLGHRTVRFSWPAVEAALKRLTVKEIGG